MTGFGLLGHSLEMAEGSEVTIKIRWESIPLVNKTFEYANMGLIPAGSYDNKNFIGDKVCFKGEISEVIKDVLYDPQTSGGLLISLPKEKSEEMLIALKNSPTKYAIIGEVVEKGDHYLLVE